MFCPKCAAQNADDAKFCRGCGADISLVPHAVTGQLAAHLRGEDNSLGSRLGRLGGGGDAVTMERVVRSCFKGLGLVFVSLAVMRYAPGGRVWWFWLLIPAFAMMADGVSTFVRLRQSQGRPAPPDFRPAPPSVRPPAFDAAGLPPRNTGELVPPPSVTEGTTRHLNIPVGNKTKQDG